ncbi:hypothetical protein HY382_02510 [Candidatus Curtissbacteria bacterium]|nr:hypothetical protein [Candidatus Curtissbacteria bacterium]
MNRKTKLFLSLIGIGAVVVPAVLLIITTSKVPKEISTSSSSRTIDSAAIDEAVKSVPRTQPQFVPPSPTATASASVRPSASPSAQGTSSANTR